MALVVVVVFLNPELEVRWHGYPSSIFVFPFSSSLIPFHCRLYHPFLLPLIHRSRSSLPSHSGQICGGGEGGYISHHPFHCPSRIHTQLVFSCGFPSPYRRPHKPLHPGIHNCLVGSVSSLPVLYLDIWSSPGSMSAKYFFPLYQPVLKVCPMQNYLNKCRVYLGGVLI